MHTTLHNQVSEDTLSDNPARKMMQFYAYLILNRPGAKYFNPKSWVFLENPYVHTIVGAMHRNLVDK